MSDTRPVGRRYSLAYSDPKEPVYESRRLQARAGAYFKEKFHENAYSVNEHLAAELGVDLGHGYAHEAIKQYLAKCQTSDFLDAVTVIAEALSVKDRGNRYHSDPARRALWVAFLQRAFAEENSKFELDAKGGVHPRIDATFTTERVSALKGMDHGRYLAAREHFEQTHLALDERPPATNRAIREIYMANEEVFKLVCPEATSLDPGEINRRLVPVLGALLQGPEKDAVNGMLRAASDYASASHQYRHAQGQPELAPASMETATFMVGTGTALLRWLIWLDGKRQAEAAPVLSV